jgi:hypothetical protein
MAAVQELARGWKDDPDTLPLLKDRARFGENDSERMAAVKELALGWKDDPDTLLILKNRARADTSHDVREAAVQGLASGWQGDSFTLPFLIESARLDEHYAVKIAALKGIVLGWKNDPLTQAQLLTYAEDTQHEKLRVAAVGELARHYSSDPSIRSFLLNKLRHDLSSTVRYESARGFRGHHWDAPTRSALLQISKSDPDLRVRDRIGVAIGLNPSPWKRWFLGITPEDEIPSQVCRLQVGSVRLRNIRMFADTTVDFDSGHTLLLGDNAAGKTTLLRAIALAGLGRDLALKIEPRPASYVREGTAKGFIEVVFRLYTEPEPTHLSDEITASLEIRHGETSFLATEQKDLTPESRNCIERLGVIRRKDAVGRFGFLCAYGSKRTFADPSQTMPTRDDAVVDRVASLFDAQAPVIDPDRVSKLLAGNTSAFREAPTTLDEKTLASMKRSLGELLPNCDITNIPPGSELRIHDNLVDLRDLSDGYASLLALAGHLFLHALGASDWTGTPPDVNGVVLIDELDAHLHPAWQRRILPDLRRTFPNLQIIATSHSPMVAGSAEPQAIRLLKRACGDVKAIADLPSIAGWRADQILTSALFDLPTTRDTKIEILFQDYANRLAEAGPDDSEVRRLGPIVSKALEIKGEGIVERATHELLEHFLLEQFRSLDEDKRRLVLARAGLVLGGNS